MAAFYICVDIYIKKYMMISEIHKNRGHKIKSQKGKVNRRNSIRGTQRFTKPSPTVDGAKVQIKSETTARAYWILHIINRKVSA